MKEDRHIKLVEQLLLAHSSDKKFDNIKDYMIWQRGFLTGFLASVARDDFYAECLIKKSIKRKTGQDV